MASLLVPIRTKLSIHAHRRVWELLEGEYASMTMGRSMDFEDLREYVAGDDLKDIDWKATARSGSPLVKRYSAQRRHNVLFVVDSGRGMAAHASPTELKRDLAITTVGILGYVAQQHGDLVALAHGDATRSDYQPLRGSLTHLERLLQHLHGATTPTAPPSDITRQLDFVACTVTRRTMLVVVSDDGAIGPEHDRLLRRLRAQHELLWVTVGDLDPTSDDTRGSAIVDIDRAAELPSFLRGDARLAGELRAATVTRAEAATATLRRLGVPSVRVTGEAELLPGIVRLLDSHRHASHHGS